MTVALHGFNPLPFDASLRQISSLDDGSREPACEIGACVCVCSRACFK